MSFFYCVSVFFITLYYYIDNCVIRSRSYLGIDFSGILVMAFVFAIPLTGIYYVSLAIPPSFKENSIFSFAKRYGFTQADPESLKQYEEKDPDLSLILCGYSSYENCITLQKDGITYYMNERYVSVGKGGNYETICLIKHNKCDFPSFYMRQRDPIADTISKYLLRRESIDFPEDSAFSKKYILKERPSLLFLCSKKDVKNYFNEEIREAFIKNYVYDAIFYSCDTYEFKIKVPRRLKETEKEKIFNLANTLFLENDNEFYSEYFFIA